MVLLLVGGLGVLGLSRGFVLEFFAVAKWIAAMIVTRLYVAPLTSYLHARFPQPGAAEVLAFGLLFAGVLLAMGLFGGLLKRATSQASLGGFDRLLGAVFGMAKGILLAAIGVLLFTLGYDVVYGGSASRPSAFTTSRSYPFLKAVGDEIMRYAHARRAQ